MAARARGRGSSHGIHGPILETSLGNAGAVLEADTRAARRRRSEVRNAAFSAGAIQSRTAGTQEGFSRCRTPGEAAGGSGIDSELCARCRAASVADGDTQEVPADARSRAPAEPIGVSSGEAHIKLSSLVSNLLGASARRMLKALAEGETNPAALAALADQNLRATPEQVRCAVCMHGSQSHVPAAADDDAGGIAIP